MAKNEKRAIEAKEVEQVAGGTPVKGTTKWDTSTECIPDGVVSERRAQVIEKLGGSAKAVKGFTSDEVFPEPKGPGYYNYY